MLHLSHYKYTLYAFFWVEIDWMSFEVGLEVPFFDKFTS